MASRHRDKQIGLAGWIDRTAWIALLLTAGLTPLLLADSRAWGGADPFFYSGPLGIQALAALAMTGVSFACWALAWAVGYRELRWIRVLWLPAAYLGWVVVSTVGSVSPATAVIGLDGRFEGLLAQLVYVALLFLVVQLADSQARLRALARVLVTSGGLVCAYGVLQALSLDPVFQGAVDWNERAFGTMGNPDMFGGFALIVLFVSLGNALSEKDSRWRVASFVSATLAVLGTYSSYSRAAWVALVAGGVLAVLAAWRLKLKLSRLDLIFLGALVATLVVAVVVPSLAPSTSSPSRLASTIAATTNVAHRNTASRFELWRIALRSIADRPVLGSGPETFGLVSERYTTLTLAKTAGAGIIEASPHNVYLHQASDLGILGALLWLAVLLVVAVVSAKWILDEGPPASLRTLLAGFWIACAALLVDYLFSPSHVVNGVLLWCLLGALLSPLATTVELSSGAARKSLAGLAAVAGLAALVMAVLFMFADHQAAIAVTPYRDPDVRVAAAQRAIALNPLSAAYVNLGFEASSDGLSAQLDAQPVDTTAVQQVVRSSQAVREQDGGYAADRSQAVGRTFQHSSAGSRQHRFEALSLGRV